MKAVDVFIRWFEVRIRKKCMGCKKVKDCERIKMTLFICGDCLEKMLKPKFEENKTK